MNEPVSKGAGHGGPAKGAGNGSRRKNFTKENAKELGRKGGLIGGAARVRNWREAHPAWETLKSGPSEKEIRGYINSHVPCVIDKGIQIALDDKHPKQFEAVRMLTEQGIGRPKQAVEFGGKDGAPFKIEIVRFGENPE